MKQSPDIFPRAARKVPLKSSMARRLIVLGLGLTLAACGGGNSDDSSAGATAGSPSEVGEMAPGGDVSEVAGSTEVTESSDVAEAGEVAEAAEVADTSEVSPEIDGETEATALASVSRNAAAGFAAGVTGGAHGNVVRVRTAEQLRNALCNDRRGTDGNLCLDNKARIIEVEGMIDLTNSEGWGAADGCYEHACSSGNARNEVTLTLVDRERYRCVNKPGRRSYSYSKAGVNGMTVGSNKTIVGIGNYSGIKGKGLRIWNGMSNVIIRNLKFTDINAGYVFGADAITLGSVSRIWIDHNYFVRIGRQMIVSGSGSGQETVDQVTISNNEFDGRTAFGCDGRHYWNLLLVGNGNITLAGNWFHHIQGRAPKLNAAGRGLQVQLVNNLFENGGSNGHALETGANVRVLAEGNYFQNMPYPVEQPQGQLYGVFQQTAASRSNCIAVLGRLCTANTATPFPKRNNMTQSSSVLNAMKPLKNSLVRPYTAASVPKMVRANAGVGRVSVTNR